ncbi:MAG: FliH/SctL family protein [Planctomycetota bacterium]
MSPDLRIRFIQPPAAIRLPNRPLPVRRRNPGGAEHQQFEQREAAGHPMEDRSARDADDTVPPGFSETPAATSFPEGARIDTPAPDWAVAVGRFEELMKRIESEATNLERRFAEEVRGLEPQLVRLALAATRKVVGKASEENGVDLASLIRDGLAKVSCGVLEKKRLVVRIGSDHEAVVREVLAERQDQGARIRIEVDRALKPFACEIHCDMRQVNIDLERELQRITSALLGGGQNDC